MTKEVTPLEFDECFEAFQIMAAETVRAYEESSSPEERAVVTGSYLLTCALANQRDEPESLKAVFALGLRVAGMEAQKAQKLAERYDTTWSHRRTFSLSYLRAVEDVPGLKRRRKSTTLDEAEFIRGIIRRNAPTQPVIS